MSEFTGERLSTRNITAAVLVAILAAAAIIFAVWKASQPSGFDCAAQQADYQLGNIERWEVDQPCR